MRAQPRLDIRIVETPKKFNWGRATNVVQQHHRENFWDKLGCNFLWCGDITEVKQWQSVYVRKYYPRCINSQFQEQKSVI